MRIFNFITGRNFNSLINYFDNPDAKEVTEHTLNIIWGKQRLINPLSVVAIMMFLMFSFSIPIQMTLVNFDLSPPVAVSIIGPAILIVVLLVVLAMKATVKGSKWAVIIFKYLFMIDLLIFLIAFCSSFLVGEIHWEIILIIAGMLLLSRFLMNGNSFMIVIKFYLHQRLALKAIAEVADKERMHQGE